jgi:hypothetical protein
MQATTADVTEGIVRSLDTSSYALAVDVGGADGALLQSLMQHNLLRFILHDWHDAKAIRILENCRRVMKPNARLLVIEAFLPEVGEDVPPTMSDTQVPLIDLHVMVATDGRERSLAEYDALFGKADLRRVRTTLLDNGYVVIETAAA